MMFYYVVLYATGYFNIDISWVFSYGYINATIFVFNCFLPKNTAYIQQKISMYKLRSYLIASSAVIRIECAAIDIYPQLTRTLPSKSVASL